MISLEAMLYKQNITFDAAENRIRYDSTWLLYIYLIFLDASPILSIWQAMQPLVLSQT